MKSYLHSIKTNLATTPYGASNLFVQIFGPKAGHVPLVYGVQSLPVGAPLIVETYSKSSRCLNQAGVSFSGLGTELRGFYSITFQVVLRCGNRKMFQMEIDNLNQSTSASRHIILSKYQSYLSKLYANKSVIDSLANLKDKAQTEQKLYEHPVITSSHYSKLIEWYDFACF